MPLACPAGEGWSAVRVDVVDATLIRRGGHPFDWARRLGRQLLLAGHDVRFFVHASAAEDVLAALGSLGPTYAVFRAYPHANAGRLDALAGELLKYTIHANLLRVGLGHAVGSDLWLWPTFFPAGLYACATLPCAPGVVGLVHQDPGIGRTSDEAKTWRHAFVSARMRGLQFSIGTPEEELCRRLQPLFHEQLPIRYPYPADADGLLAPKVELKRIGIFGSQRGEKGVELLPALVRHLLRAGYQVTLHDSSGRAPWPSGHPGLRVLGYIDNLADEVSACDAVILPYHADRYATHGSGILMDCLACGVPFIAPQGALFDATITKTGSGLRFPDLSAASIMQTIREVHHNFSDYAARAYQAALIWRQTEGTARLVSHVTSAFASTDIVGARR